MSPGFQIRLSAGWLMRQPGGSPILTQCLMTHPRLPNEGNEIQFQAFRSFLGELLKTRDDAKHISFFMTASMSSCFVPRFILVSERK
jgi:hypothetical protein